MEIKDVQMFYDTQALYIQRVSKSSFTVTLRYSFKLIKVL